MFILVFLSNLATQYYRTTNCASAPTHGLTRALDSKNLSLALEIQDEFFPYSDPLDLFNHFNPRFTCPRCGSSAEIVKRKYRKILLKCPSCGYFIKQEEV